MKKGITLSECQLSLEKVTEGTNRTVDLLQTTIEKLGALMAATKGFQRSNDMR